MIIGRADIASAIIGRPVTVKEGRVSMPAALHRAWQAGVLSRYVRKHGKFLVMQEDAVEAARDAVLRYQREETAARAERSGEYGPWVPATYFRVWLQGILSDPSVTMEFLAKEMQVDLRRLYAWREQTDHIPYLLLEDALWNFKCIHVERICPSSAILISRPTNNRETEDDRQEANDGRDALGGPGDVRGGADGEERERAGDAEGVPGQRDA